MDHRPNNINTLIPTEPKPKPPCFLCCFGFSRKPNKPGDSRMRKRSWPWSRLPGKKSATKTVPVDSTVSGNITPTNNKLPLLHGSKSKPKGKPDKFSSSKRQNTTSPQSPAALKVLPPNRPSEVQIAQAIQTSEGSDEEKIILENVKHLDEAESPKDVNDTCRNPLSFRRKINAIRNGFNRPGSPEIKPTTNRTSSPDHIKSTKSSRTSTSILRTTLAAPNHQVKKAHNNNKERDEERAGKKIDPVVGMSIIMVTLVIMLVWGRLCAILCTSAWFYLIRRLRTGRVDQDEANSSKAGFGEEDFNSEEYKKRVVLQGLLERKHRSSS